MKKYCILTFLVFAFASCARVATLNTKYHTFSETPNHIIWIQVAGLNEEHLAFTKFNPQNASKKSVLEESACVGKAWAFNLFDLRPKALQGFMSQMTGSKKVDGTCADLERSAVWEFFAQGGYQSSVLESDGDPQNSLKQYLSCKGSEEYFKNTGLILMTAKVGERGDFYHFENSNFQPQKGNLYFDKSCQKGACFSSLHTNAKHIYKSFVHDKTKSLFIVKDHSLQAALLNQDRAKIIETLENLEDMILYFQNFHSASEKPLILITSTSSRNIEMPVQGPEWGKLLDKKTDLIFKRNSLLSPVWSMGSRAENFCGFFEEDEIFERLYWDSDKTTIDFKRLF